MCPAFLRHELGDTAKARAVAGDPAPDSMTRWRPSTTGTARPVRPRCLRPLVAPGMNPG